MHNNYVKNLVCVILKMLLRLSESIIANLFLCHGQARLAGRRVMFSSIPFACPSVRPFIRPSVIKRTSHDDANWYKWSTKKGHKTIILAASSHRSRSDDAEDIFEGAWQRHHSATVVTLLNNSNKSGYLLVIFGKKKGSPFYLYLQTDLLLRDIY